MSFTLAIVGRPNVGKSTLFNRLTHSRQALVHDQPGVTRDRREGQAWLGPLHFKVVDTAGLEEENDPQALGSRMMAQTRAAVAEADIILMLVDAESGILPDDRLFARLLAAQDRPVILAVNKSEKKAGKMAAFEGFELGLGDPVPLSAAHGDGMADLAEALLAALETLGIDPDERADEEQAAGKPVQLAIIGRPNAGKSTLVNRLLGEERVLTGAEAGITRDAIMIDWSFEGRPVKLVDTAGMRRRSKVDDALEKLAAHDARRSLRYAQLVVLLVDAQEALSKQDMQIAAEVVAEGRVLVVGVNKWDLVPKAAREEMMQEMRLRLDTTLAQLPGVPLVPVSAKEGGGLPELIRRALACYDLWNRRVETGPLNRWLEVALQRHPPPLAGGRRVRIKFATQTKTRPPTFALFCSRHSELPESYERYLMNGLRERFGLEGIPVRIQWRKGRNPYVK